MVNPENFFDLYDVLVNELFGSIFLFTFIGLILIFFFSSKLRIPSAVGMLFAMLFLLIVIAEVFDALLIAYVFIGLITASVFGLGINAWMKR